MNEDKFTTSEEKTALIHWHRWLEENRGDRARLRRAEAPEDILLTGAFFNFLHKMPDGWRKNKPMLVSASVAGLLSHVKDNKRTLSRGYQPKNKKQPPRMASFAELLATPIKDQKKPPMSEMRFQQLQKSRTIDAFYRNMIRAIRLLDGQVNISSLANDIIHWLKEFDTHLDRNPANRLAVRWATDYFTALPKESK